MIPRRDLHTALQHQPEPPKLRAQTGSVTCIIYQQGPISFHRPSLCGTTSRSTGRARHDNLVGLRWHRTGSDKPSVTPAICFSPLGDGTFTSRKFATTRTPTINPFQRKASKATFSKAALRLRKVEGCMINQGEPRRVQFQFPKITFRKRSNHTRREKNFGVVNAEK